MNNMEELTLEVINVRFNEELQQQIGGTLPKGHVYKLGNPSEALLSNLDNLPLEMAASTFLGSKHKEIGRDLLKWRSKERAFDWLTDNASNVRSVGLSIKGITKVVQNFQNPKPPEENIFRQEYEQ